MINGGKKKKVATGTLREGIYVCLHQMMCLFVFCANGLYLEALHILIYFPQNANDFPCAEPAC